MVLVARLIPALASEFLVGSWFLLVLVLIPGLVGFVRCRPVSREVALRFDRAAALQEHLSTWEEIRRRGLPTEPVARSFALLQRAATLRVAEGLRPGRLLPIVLPAWSRALWLALLLLGCAILMPEQRAVPGRMSGVGGEGEGAQDGGAATIKPLAPGRLNDTFNRIEILSQAEKQKYLAMAFGQEVPEVLKAEALKEIEAKVGGLSEADLSADVRELLTELRRQVHKEESSGAKPGTATVAGGAPDDASASGKPEVGVNVLTAQQALALAREHFPDVAEALQRYYLAK